MADKLLPISEAVRLTGYRGDTIRKLIRVQKIKAQKFGAVWQISRKSLDAYLRGQNKKGEKRGRKPLT